MTHLKKHKAVDLNQIMFLCPLGYRKDTLQTGENCVN